MPSSSPAARASVERLRLSLCRSGSKLAAEEQSRLLDEVGEAGGSDAVPLLMSFLFVEASRVAAAAARAIERIVRSLPDLELSRLDQAVRHAGDWSSRAGILIDVVRYGRGFTGVFGMLACHPSGYIREAAVRRLATSGEGSELPHLLIRLNDWVKQVRDTAKSAVLVRIGPDYSVHFARHLPLVVRLHAQSREDHRDLVDRVLHLLRDAQSRPALLASVDSSDRECRRLAYDLLLEATEGAGVALDHGMASADAVSAPLLIAATGSNDPPTSRAAREYLDRWRFDAHRLYVRPTDAPLLFLREMLRKHRDGLDQRQVRDGEAHLSFARREWS